MTKRARKYFNRIKPKFRRVGNDAFRIAIIQHNEMMLQKASNKATEDFNRIFDELLDELISAKEYIYIAKNI